MKIKTVTENNIEAVRYLKNLPGNGYLNAIKGYCKDYQLTVDFVREFEADITKEMFSLSPKLQYNLIERFPDLFDINIWASSGQKSIEPFRSKEFRSKFTDEELNKYITSGNPYELSEELFSELFPYVSADTKKVLLAVYKGNLSKEFLMKNASYFSPEIFKNKNVVDQLTIKDVEALLKSVKDLQPHYFVNALLVRNDIAWQERMCTEVIEKKIELADSGETFNEDLKYAITSMHEDVLLKLFQVLNIHDKNAISYTVLEFLLRVKNPSEELCLALVENFKSNNLVHALGNYAKEMDYQSIIIGLFL